MKSTSLRRTHKGWQLVFAVVLTIGASAAAAASQGLDFGYAVDGPLSLRPALVFNDGSDTYIQPADGVKTSVHGAVADGPYLRVDGLPESLSISARGESMQVRHLTAPAAMPARRAGRMYASLGGGAAAIADSLGAGESVMASGEPTSPAPTRHPGTNAVPVTATASLSIAPAPVSTSAASGVVVGGPISGVATGTNSGNAAVPPLLGASSATPVRAQGFVLLKSDVTVRKAFERWAKASGWVVSWDSTVAAPLSGDMSISGAFPDAVTTTLRGLRKAGYPLWASAPDPVSKTIRVYQTVSASSFAEANQ